MHTRVCSLLFAATLLSAGPGSARGPIDTRDANDGAPAKRSVAASSARTDRIRFEQNAGQSDPCVLFLAHTARYTLFLTSSEAVFALRGSCDGNASPSAGATVRAQLVGANVAASVHADGRLPGRSNYFVGADRSRWRTNVPAYERVRFDGVYPGVDVVYYGSGERLECDFVVAGGADPTSIAWRFEGATALAVDADGTLVVKTPTGELREPAPAIYQESPHGRERIAGRYVALDAETVGFDVGAYDTRRGLVIDPTVDYCTYLGGAGETDELNDIVTGPDGSLYLVGSTWSASYPLHDPFQATFQDGVCAVITRLSASGASLDYSTYLGGSLNATFGYGIALDAAGNIYVCGSTVAPDFPTLNAAQPHHSGTTRDGFVTKLDATGSALVFSTYFGGTEIDECNGVAVDSTGKAYVTGYTASVDFPTVDAFDATFGGGRDAFVGRYAPDGALTYSSLLGGSGYEAGRGIAVDASGRVCLAGNTSSADFPTVQPAQASLAGNSDAFVTKLTPNGAALVYSTYLGGTGGETVYRLALGASGDVFVVGFTTSSDFPVQNAFQASYGGDDDAFLAHFDPSGSLLMSSYLGGDGEDSCNDVAVGTDGSVYLVGFAGSTAFPRVDPIAGSHTAPVAGDAFVTKIDPSANAIVFSSLVGGSSVEWANAVALDAHGGMYVVGYTESPDIPMVNPFQATLDPVAHKDGFVVKITFVTVPDIVAVQSVVVPGKPYRIKLTGTKFEPGLAVYLGADPTAWPTVKYKSSTRLVLSGSGLRKRFPKGVAVPIRVVNPGGGEDTFGFTR